MLDHLQFAGLVMEISFINRENSKAHTKGITANTIMQKSLLLAPC